tara:strand:+ start:832 stop:1551 length:720 start_codon:yes stop_codon:yes gene_type:complete
MNKLFPIVLALLCFGMAQDEYPYFSDPLKQLAFEEKRIYIKEESGERTLISGGDSYTALANPLGTIFLDQDPDYIAKNNPIITEIEYWYNFEIKQNNKLLTEIEFLSIIGLDDKVNLIVSDFEELMIEYNNSIDGEYVEYFEKNDWKYESLFGGLSLIMIALGYIDDEWNTFVIGSLGGAMLYGGLSEPKEVVRKKKVYANPEIAGTIPKPILKQTLSPEQIISLAESYNRRIYNEIKN